MIYEHYRKQGGRRFKWIRSSLFASTLQKTLAQDANELLTLLKEHGNWNPEEDTKLKELHILLTKKHPKEKVLIFTQFADTAGYLSRNLKHFGVTQVEHATGDSIDPTELASRCRPESNRKEIPLASNSVCLLPQMCSQKVRIFRTVPLL